MIVHHQAVIIATVRIQPEQIATESLRGFLHRLVEQIGMQELFEPIALRGKFGFTGIVGIVTSHIAFHFFEEDRSLHFDIYSCKCFDLELALRHLDSFWSIEVADVVFIERDQGPRLRRFRYAGGALGQGDEAAWPNAPKV